MFGFALYLPRATQAVVDGAPCGEMGGYVVQENPFDQTVAGAAPGPGTGPLILPVATWMAGAWASVVASLLVDFNFAHPLIAPDRPAGTLHGTGTWTAAGSPAAHIARSMWRGPWTFGPDAGVLNPVTPSTVQSKFATTFTLPDPGDIDVGLAVPLGCVNPAAYTIRLRMPWVLYLRGTLWGV